MKIVKTKILIIMHLCTEKFLYSILAYLLDFSQRRNVTMTAKIVVSID